jgi:hypothetical protein
MQPNITPGDVGTTELAASLDSPDAAVAWTLRKGGDSTQCVLCPIGDRVELHIQMKDEVIVSQHCRGPDQAAFVSNIWLAALTTRGWR